MFERVHVSYEALGVWWFHVCFIGQVIPQLLVIQRISVPSPAHPLTLPATPPAHVSADRGRRHCEARCRRGAAHPRRRGDTGGS